MILRDGGTLGLYIRTVRHLRPAQVAYRVRLRAQQAALRRWPSPFERRWIHPGGGPAWPTAFQATDALSPPDCGSLDELEKGQFTFLNETRHLGSTPGWDPEGASQLWLYHHHYWEWAWTLLAEPDRDRSRRIFGRQFSSWAEATQFGRWNAWAPYPASVRAWVFVNIEARLVRGTAIEQRFHELLRLHAGFVEHNLELDVGGNHLIKNLKALIGLGVFFDDERLLLKASDHLDRQIGIQVLPDGGHFELSPSYHCQVLGDLLDIHSLLDASSHRTIDGLPEAIGRMRTWLAAMLMPDGDVPLFNDCQLVGLERIQVLQPAPPPDGILIVLPDSGYVVAKPGERMHLVADVGAPCPPELPAHAHADCLTFELAIDGHRAVVDPGSSVYSAGPQRQWERSTEAHNTLTIDGTNQTEVWASFRAGRRATGVLDRAQIAGRVIDIRAHHDGYCHMQGNPTHHRRWLISPEAVVITDLVEGAGAHILGSRLQLNAEKVLHDAGGPVDCETFRVSVLGSSHSGEGPEVRIGRSSHAVRHGELRDSVAVVGEWRVRLPAELSTTITLMSASQGPELTPPGEMA